MNAKAFETAQHFLTAATSSSGWRPALDSAVDLLKAEHAMILACDAGGSPFIADNARMHQSDFERYLTPVAQRWLRPLQQAMPMGIAVRLSPLMFREEEAFERSEMYNEIIRPAGGYYDIGVQHRLADITLFVAACRSKKAGNFEVAEISNLQSLLRSIATSVELFRRLQIVESERLDLTSVLDRMRNGIVLLDQFGTVTFSNAQARRILDERDGLHISADGKLETAIPFTTRSLRLATAHLAALSGSEGRHFHIPRLSGRYPLRLRMLPVTRSEIKWSGSGLAKVVVFLEEIDASVSIDSTAIAKIFGLTRRESEIAVRIAGSQSPDEIADALHLRVSTVRTHLVHIYEKTGVRSRAALVALLCRFIEPMM